MKRIFHALLVLFLLVSQFSVAKAQDNQENSSITISPSITIINENDLGGVSEIKLENGTDKELTFKPVEVYVGRNEDGQTIILDSKPEFPFFEFDDAPITIKAGKSATFPVRLKLLLPEFDGFPAIAFNYNNESDDVDLNTSSLSVFLVQDFTGTLSVNNDVSINQSGIALQPNFEIDGKVINDGQKFYEPAGSVSIYKGETLLSEEEISTQISGLLFPGEEKSYKTSWQNKLGLFESIGSYSIQIKLKPSPFSQTFVTRIDFIYIPVEIIGAGVLILLLTSAVLLIASKKKKRAAK